MEEGLSTTQSPKPCWEREWHVLALPLVSGLLTIPHLPLGLAVEVGVVAGAGLGAVGIHCLPSSSSCPMPVDAQCPCSKL